MMKRKRRFYTDAATHVYQRAVNGFNIFYTLEDRLVFYTVFSHFVRKCRIKVSGLCLMIDHIHTLVHARTRQELSSFILLYTSLYARLFNASRRRNGRLFEKSFGSAPKCGDKKTRTAISYVLNNPVEKGMCGRAEDYRWNFLSYAETANPFSDAVKIEAASKPLRRAMSEVRRFRDEDMYLGYVVLRRLYKSLGAKDRERLTDYIITIYNPIDYGLAKSYYGSYEDMLVAVNSNTGSEYNIHEEYNPYSDSVYQTISDFIQETLKIDLWQIVSLSDEDKIRIADLLRKQLPVTNRQLCKFLHLVVADA